MELTDLPGIGPAYSERLRASGIADVAALAAATDLDALRSATGISRARLEAARLAAVRAVQRDEDDLGIATEGVAHAADAAAARLARHLEGAWRDARILATAKVAQARAKVEPIARRLPAPAWARVRGVA